MGWKTPLQNDVELANVQEGSAQGAYTTVDYCGRGFVPYIVAYAGSFSNRSWAETMAVHELNHALQFGYGFAWEFWWWEVTATYGMDDAFDDLDLHFDAGYADFIVNNTVMDYADQGVIPNVDERASTDELPDRPQVDGGTRPQGFGQTYIRFEKEAGEGDLVVSFEGEEDVCEKRQHGDRAGPASMERSVRSR